MHAHCTGRKEVPESTPGEAAPGRKEVPDASTPASLARRRGLA